MVLVVDHLRRLYRFRELLYMLTLRDFKLRYKQAAMGFLWAILMPMVIVGAGIVIRMLISQSATIGRGDLASIIVKSLPWSFFVASLRTTTASLVGNSNLVSKVAFPKEVFPISAVASALFDFSVACIVAIVVLAVLQTPVHWTALLAPLLMLPLVVLVIGLGLILSALNLFFRDVKYIIEVILTFAIFFTPVLYDVSMLGRFASIAMLNPVAPILESLGSLILEGNVGQWPWLLYSCVVAVLTLTLGYRVFKNLEIQFAERI